MAYLLDTNIVSDLVRNPRGRVRLRLNQIPEDEVFTSVIVAAELRFGAVRRNSARLSAQLEAVLTDLAIVSLEPPADRIYADIRTQLEASGTPIGTNDLLIAAHTLALGYTLVTDNVREFSRIDGLSVENWLR